MVRIESDKTLEYARHSSASSTSILPDQHQQQPEVTSHSEEPPIQQRSTTFRSSLKKDASHKYSASHTVARFIPKFEEEDLEEDYPELDIDEILACDDSEIENLSIMKSSKKLISSVEAMMNQIDEKLRSKRPGGLYFTPYGQPAFTHSYGQQVGPQMGAKRHMPNNSAGGQYSCEISNL